MGPASETCVALCERRPFSTELDDSQEKSISISFCMNVCANFILPNVFILRAYFAFSGDGGVNSKVWPVVIGTGLAFENEL